MMIPTVNTTSAVIIVRALYIVAAEASRIPANGGIGFSFFDGLVRACENLFLTPACSVEVIQRLYVDVVWQSFNTVCVIPMMNGQHLLNST